MPRTKKIGSAGRFGSRYGRTIRQKVVNIENRQNIKHECPTCHRFAIKRIAKGIFLCTGCNYKFAGRAYTPTE